MPVTGPSKIEGKTTVTTTQSPTKAKRRNNRVDDDPRRCEQIAKLLVAGHKGSSLEAMVKQFDAETALRGQQSQVASPVPESAVKRSSASQVVRRSSSCPPLDIAAAEIFRSDGPKTTSGPIRRPKPLRGASTLPYPPTFKSSRSVSPPITPSYLTVSTPIEGPFAHSTFSFASSTHNPIPQLESVGPKDPMFFNHLSSPTDMEPFYNWPMQTLSADNSFYSMHPSSQPNMVAPSASAPVLRLQMPDGHSSDTGWNSEFEWVPTEDEAGTSTAPPSTPEAPSPVVGMAQGLPLEEVAAQAPPFSTEVTTPTNDLVDLSEYAKGLQLFSPQDNSFAQNGFQLGSLNLNDLQSLNSNPFDQQSLWQIQNLIHGMSPEVNTGTEEYHY